MYKVPIIRYLCCIFDKNIAGRSYFCFAKTFSLVGLTEQIKAASVDPLSFLYVVTRDDFANGRRAL